MVSLVAFRSLRARLMALLLVGVIVPLSAMGWWTTRTAVRSGRALLQSQLDSALTQAVNQVESRWRDRQSDLLLLVENEPTRRLLVDSTTPGRPAPFVERAFAQLSNVDYVRLRDSRGLIRWTLGNQIPAPPPRAGENGLLLERFVTARIPVRDIVRGDTVGSVEARINAAALLPSIAAAAPQNGPVPGLRTADGGMLVPPGADETVFSRGADRSGKHWLVTKRQLALPLLEVSMAAALDPVVAPFERAANTAFAALLAAALLVTCVVLVAGRRITAELERAVVAAEAVAAGDLDRQLPVSSKDEVGRLASAFNAMTLGLRRTLDELTRKEAMAAVGEFASELAHEVRNPLTSMRLDLQRADEEADDPATVRAVVPRVLRQVDRLDRAVTGALRVARGNRIEDRGRVDLADVLRVAAATTKPEFDRRGAALIVAPLDVAHAMDGDAASLEQVFVNLLLNAAQALEVGGRATITVSEREHEISISVRDTGVGMSTHGLQRLATPFPSSKRDGVGLGLKIARRIVQTHGGRLEIDSTPGVGTTVVVTLPKRVGDRASTSAAAPVEVATAGRPGRDRV